MIRKAEFADLRLQPDPLTAVAGDRKTYRWVPLQQRRHRLNEADHSLGRPQFSYRRNHGAPFRELADPGIDSAGLERANSVVNRADPPDTQPDGMPGLGLADAEGHR